MLDATVIKSTGSWYIVRTNDGSIIRARTRGKMRLHIVDTSNPVAVGDVAERAGMHERGAALESLHEVGTNGVVEQDRHRERGHLLVGHHAARVPPGIPGAQQCSQEDADLDRGQMRARRYKSGVDDAHGAARLSTALDPIFPAI